jgi:hypothetical protein
VAFTVFAVSWPTPRIVLPHELSEAAVTKSAAITVAVFAVMLENSLDEDQIDRKINFRQRNVPARKKFT